MDDGVIKFSYQLISEQIGSQEELSELIYWRQRLFSDGLIGLDQASQVAFGNISAKIGSKIYISASQTGGKEHSTPTDYVEILSWKFSPAQINYQGINLPSSETLTHLAIFEENKKINWVFHFHYPKLWAWLIDQGYPSTSAEVPYGTEGMSQEVRSLAKKQTSGIIVLKGHQDGVITFGETAEQAYSHIPQLFN